MWIRKLFLWILIGTVVGSNSCKLGTVPGGNATWADACSYLWKQQGEDGAWHSETHSLMKGGHALTPFVLWALLQVPDSVFRKDPSQVQAGLNYLRTQLRRHHHLGFADPDIIEYPNYSNAYALMVLSHFGDPSDAPFIKNLQDYLVSQQFTERRGFGREDWVYGGWGFGEKLIHGESGQVDLSHTRRVAQALRQSGYTSDSLQQSLKMFLRLLQKNPRDTREQPGIENTRPYFDGGFYYSPVVWGANKGQQQVSGAFQSYPTATCDGYLTLLTLDQTQEDQKHALDYLLEHASLFTWDGLERSTAQTWAQAMQYYHLMVRSEVYAASKTPGAWSQEMQNWFRKTQKPDGSFSNPLGAISKEDDPILCTAMVVTALSKCRQADNFAPSISY